jgi:uncharacterized protein
VFKPPTPQRVAIAGPAGSLEAVVEDPGEGDALAVVCHPHPLFGGTMDNKVVHTLARALQQCAIATLRFNFRGVGASGGEFDHGRGETDDAAAVADWAGRFLGRQRLLLAGFSFGSYVALRLNERRAATRLITVAPPVGRFDFSELKTPACPWLLVQGAADELVDSNAVVAWAEALRPAPKVVLLPGVSHFFHGQLTVLREQVMQFVESKK